MGCHLCFVLLLFIVPINAAANVAVYWGQDKIGMSSPQLSEVCQWKSDTVVITFLNYFFDSDNLPRLDLSNYCRTTFERHPYLLHCPHIAKQIIDCQKKSGKKVMLSLGGPYQSYNFTSDQEAIAFAHIIWNMFLEGESETLPRPFDRAILDGIDLFIQAGSRTGYPMFVQALYNLTSSSSRKYFISISSSCENDFYVSHIFANATSKSTINFLNVLFCDCPYDELDPLIFESKWTTWSDQELPINIGLTGNSKQSGYVSCDQSLLGLLSIVKGSRYFLGMIIWDASLVKRGNDAYIDCVYNVLNKV